MKLIKLNPNDIKNPMAYVKRDRKTTGSDLAKVKGTLVKVVNAYVSGAYKRYPQLETYNQIQALLYVLDLIEQIESQENSYE